MAKHEEQRERRRKRRVCTRPTPRRLLRHRAFVLACDKFTKRVQYLRQEALITNFRHKLVNEICSLLVSMAAPVLMTRQLVLSTACDADVAFWCLIPALWSWCCPTCGFRVHAV